MHHRIALARAVEAPVEPDIDIAMLRSLRVQENIFALKSSISVLIFLSRATNCHNLEKIRDARGLLSKASKLERA